MQISVDNLPSIIYIIIKEGENKRFSKEKGEKTMTTNNDKKLTREEFEELMRLLNKAENENIEILEGLESLIRWTIIGKKLRHED